MSLLRDFFSPRRRLLLQQREISALRLELAALKTQNNSMRDGMRRCVTCEYRIDARNRQAESLEAHIAENEHTTETDITKE